MADAAPLNILGTTRVVPRLLEGEHLANIKNVVSERGKLEPPSSIRELHRLARADSHDQIGDYGPVLASKALEESSPDVAMHRYEAVFGRDSLRVAMDLIDQYPKLARTTLLRLAEMQGVTVNIAREEEPGKIIHESRNADTDPVAIELKRRDGWDWPYYGSVDSTVEFIRTISTYCRLQGYEFLNQHFSGRDGRYHTMADSYVAAVDWMVAKLDNNKEGLLEFKKMSAHGLDNQAWKDSWDAYFHANGEIANHKLGIASVEVQRVAFDALLDAVEFYELHLDKAQKAQELRQRADKLKESLMTYMWSEDKGGYFVLGTDRDDSGKLRQLQILTSNMGHMLHSSVLLAGEEPENVRRREAVINHLFSPEMLNQSGVRTLATTEYRYRPGAYHNGSVWLWDNYLILQGLELHGYHRLAENLERRIKDVITVTHQFPEFVRGDDSPTPAMNKQIIEIWDEKSRRMNVLEQPPQEVQAWTVAAIISMEQTKKISSLATPNKRTIEFENSILKSLKT